MRDVKLTRQIVDQCDVLGVSQFVTSPTRVNNILDLLLGRGLLGVRVSACPRPNILSSDHDEVIISFRVACPAPVRATRSTALNYRRGDFDGLRQALGIIPWHLFDGLDMDEAVSLFYTFVERAIRDHIPLVVLKKLYPPWFDAVTRRALRLKRAAFERLKRHHRDLEIRTDFMSGKL